MTNSDRRPDWTLIAQLRKGRNLTQEAFAARCGVDAAQIRRWESGATKILNPTSVDRVARGLRMSKQTLLDVVSGARTADSVVWNEERDERHIVTEADLKELMQIARDAAISGGIAVAPYFKSALYELHLLAETPNPPTDADTAATLEIVRRILPLLDEFTNRRHIRFCIFGEEFDKKYPKVAEQIDRAFGPSSPGLARTAKEFTAALDSRVGVLVDAIDGSVALLHELPLFRTAVAIFDGRLPCVGAVYDPIGHTVLYGSAPMGNTPGAAYEWQIGRPPMPLRRRRHDALLFATHLSRSNEQLRNRFLPVVGALAGLPGCRGVGMFLSGQLAMSLVATGSISAYLNPSTSTYDCAAADVLIRANGGKVTDFAGEPIDYSATGPVEVIATLDEHVHEQVRDVVERTFRRRTSWDGETDSMPRNLPAATPPPAR